MSPLRLHFPSRCALLVAAMTASATAQNLLQNASFENPSSLAPWTVVAGGAAIGNYGAAELPDVAVAQRIGGGNLMVRDVSSGIVEQVVAPPAIPPGSKLIVEGYLGAGLFDDTRMAVRFLAGTTQIGAVTGAYVTNVERNFEAVLLRRRMVVDVPAAATSFAVRIEFRNTGCCDGNRSAADNLTATLVAGPTTPAPVAMNAELLANPGFEAGWIPGSPLMLNDLRGWEGAGGADSIVRPYTNLNALLPSGAVSCIVSGAAPNQSCIPGVAAGNYLGHTGTTAISQRLDVSGNTPSFASGALALLLGADLGGATSEPDSASVIATFRDPNGNPLRSAAIGPVTPQERNYETVVLRREIRTPVPPNTAFIDIVVAMDNQTCCGGERAVVDNVSAMIVANLGVSAIPLNVNLLANAGWESGSFAGTPLQLTNPTGWFGAGASRARVLPYGNADTPAVVFAQNNALGTRVLQDGGNSTMRCVVDLSGTSLVATGRLAMQPVAWFGGFASEGDTAELRLEMQDALGSPVGAIQILPPVTPAERQNQTTLVQRIGAPFPVPANAARVVVDLIFRNFNCCGGERGLADDVRLVAFDTAAQGSGVPYPGTGGDLALMTGVDELPRTGLGHYIKDAAAGSVLRTAIGSPNGTLDGAPMVLAVNVIQTGNAPTPLLPGLVLNPTTAITIFSGLGGGVVGPLIIPLSQGGNVWSQLIPPTASGTSLLIQAFCLPRPNVPAPNGLFFGSDGHEIRLL